MFAGTSLLLEALKIVSTDLSKKAWRGRRKYSTFRGIFTAKGGPQDGTPPRSHIHGHEMHRMDARSKATRSGLVVAAVATLTISGCSLSTGPGNMPTVAHIVVDGTAQGSLMLVVSTDFYEVLNSTDGTISESYNSADSTSIALPYDNKVQLASNGSISVRLRYAGSGSATVHMQVSLDNGQGYDKQATISGDQELSYVYVYNQPTFH